MKTNATDYYCEVCGEVHAAKCPKLSAKRREQVREAQRRYRAKRKAEAATDWKAEAEYWKKQAQVAHAEVSKWREKVRYWTTRAEAAEQSARAKAGSLSALAKASGSRRALISLLHPDKHRNSRAANGATAYVIKHLPK